MHAAPSKNAKGHYERHAEFNQETGCAAADPRTAADRHRLARFRCENLYGHRQQKQDLLLVFYILLEKNNMEKYFDLVLELLELEEKEKLKDMALQLKDHQER